METSWRAAKQLVPALSPRSTTEESGLLEQNGAELTEETVTLESSFTILFRLGRRRRAGRGRGAWDPQSFSDRRRKSACSQSV